MADEVEEKKLHSVLSAVFGTPHQALKTLNDIPIVLRTLYDTEIADALRRSLLHPNIQYQIHDIKRWKLAYALVSINEVELPPNVEDRYKVFEGDSETGDKGWPNYFVEIVYDLYEQVRIEEDELVDTLKKSSETAEEMRDLPTEI